jgi:hypothetical protein
MRVLLLSLFLLLLCTPCQAIFFPKLRCLLRLGLMRFDVANFDRYEKFFRDDSYMRIAETGAFKGIDEMKEYVQMGAAISPYFTTDSIVDAIRFEALGYDQGSCSFLGMTVVTQTSDPTHTGGDVTFRTAAMTKIELNLEDGYVESMDGFLPRGFWDVALRGLQDSDNTRAFICSVMETECAEELPEGAADDCLTKLSSSEMPFTTSGDDGILRFEEDSSSCRALHAALAQIDSEQHCPHISFEPMEDPNGKTKCQPGGAGTLYTHQDLFTAEQLSNFAQYMEDAGFDESGTDFTLN